MFQIQKTEGDTLTCYPNQGECSCGNVANGEYVGHQICCHPTSGPLSTKNFTAAAEVCSLDQPCLAICNITTDNPNFYCCSSFPYSSTTTTAPPPGPSACFPSSARVHLQNGKSVTMSQLQIGDQVLAGKEGFY